MSNNRSGLCPTYQALTLATHGKPVHRGRYAGDGANSRHQRARAGNIFQQDGIKDMKDEC